MVGKLTKVCFTTSLPAENGFLMQKFISTNKKTKRAKLVENRNNFYLSFFDAENKNYPQEIQVNGFWLIKSWNPERNQPQVSLYTEESYKKFKQTPITADVFSS